MSDKNIPLSELIRIGVKISKVQCQGLYRRSDMATCAIGAAHLAKTGELAPVNRPLYDQNPSIMALVACGVNPDKVVNHPMYSGTYPLIQVIITLNDDYKWSREKIADWLESIHL